MADNLSSVNNNRTDWRIRVRITRMWPSFNSNQHFVGFNMILLDSEDYHVLAVVYPSVWNNIGNLILESNAYDIQNFIVREPRGHMRPVSSNKVIVLTNYSIVHPVPLEVITIPRHKFELTPLSDIEDLARSYGSNISPIHAIDIVGFARNVQPVRQLNTPNGSKKFARFQLCDGSKVVNVIAWDEHVEQLAHIYEGFYDVPPIVIMATVKPRIFNGSLQISTCNSSFVFVNIDYVAVNELRQRLIDEENAVHVDSP